MDPLCTLFDFFYENTSLGLSLHRTYKAYSEYILENFFIIFWQSLDVLPCIDQEPWFSIRSHSLSNSPSVQDAGHEKGRRNCSIETQFVLEIANFDGCLWSPGSTFSTVYLIKMKNHRSKKLPFSPMQN